mmetsp:Transcript_95371/g.253394  ORF Transcript_95371/g.253394 Transcript_95371/m.253394 type:complete len:299 (-) Transcript_95371:62-958(-)|eukprot:CAMPEP_0171210474 /NCGR_PEP_ID=MMETSP0790-20130122/29129_1 /TAXON_ID=2925 /ORGANISM="Alexandrium catenella, Strain OF101" /LENGTH=298 /DNA_ID=CAMNT_0011676115 /DNA_START=67 /DNA_END=963 /DNA_ORIENTATION=-
MTARICSIGLLFLSCAPLAVAADAEVEPLEALAVDDQCAAGASDEACTLSALQLRGAKAENGTEPEDPDLSFDAKAFRHGCGCCCNHEEKISNVWGTCADSENACCKSCGIWHAEHSHGKSSHGGHGVKFVGEKVCPSRPVGGMESINSGSAGSLDYLWSAAAGKAGHSAQMALMSNPWQSRTQHQLHILVKPLDNRGHHLAHKLEKITGCRTGKWHSAHFACHYSKARLFDGMPPVFSEVYKLASKGAMGHLISNPQGQKTLASVGITVLFICNGKPVVLATGNGNGFCSVEHAITR